MNDDTKVRRVTAMMEGNFRELAKIDAAEFCSDSIDRLMAKALIGPTKRQRISEWMKREQERAVIDRVTDKLCPPEPTHDDRIDAMRYAFGYTFGVKRPSDFGVIAINSVV